MNGRINSSSKRQTRLNLRAAFLLGVINNGLSGVGFCETLQGITSIVQTKAKTAMRSKWRLVSVWLMMWLISACGGNEIAPTEPLPTVVNANSTAAPTIDNAITLVLPTTVTLPPQETPTPEITIEGALPVPGPRTLVASQTEDPNANVPFTQITLVRTEGPLFAGSPQPPLNIEIQADGTVTYAGIAGQLSTESVDQINLLIREINFFGMQNNYISAAPVTGSDEYVYQLTVLRGEQERLVTARDSFMPQELKDMVAYILNAAQRATS